MQFFGALPHRQYARLLDTTSALRSTCSGAQSRAALFSNAIASDSHLCLGYGGAKTMDSSPKWHAVPLEAARETLDLRSLSTLHKGARGRVSRVVENAAPVLAAGLVAAASVAAAGVAAAFDGGAEPSIARRLIELGFVAGEHIEVIGEAQPGGDPISGTHWLYRRLPCAGARRTRLWSRSRSG